MLDYDEKNKLKLEMHLDDIADVGCKLISRKTMIWASPIYS